jgi:hypothetical protein
MVEMIGPCCSDKQLPSAELVVLVFTVLFIYCGYLKKTQKIDAIRWIR